MTVQRSTRRIGEQVSRSCFTTAGRSAQTICPPTRASEEAQAPSRHNSCPGRWFLASVTKAVLAAYLSPGGLCRFLGLSASTSKWMQTATLGGRVSGILYSNSEQVDLPEEFLKTTVGAIAIKDRIDGEVFHPDSVIAIRSLQPFECVFIAFQRCVDLGQPVGRNVTLP